MDVRCNHTVYKNKCYSRANNFITVQSCDFFSSGFVSWRLRFSICLQPREKVEQQIYTIFFIVKTCVRHILFTFALVEFSQLTSTSIRLTQSPVEVSFFPPTYVLQRKCQYLIETSMCWHIRTTFFNSRPFFIKPKWDDILCFDSV